VDECADYFEQKGYSPIQTRARIGGLSYLFEYYPGCIIHKKIVGWSPEKNNQLVSILKEAYIERLDSGRLLGDLDEVFDLYEEQLPQLNNNICWTRRLLTSIVLQMDSINVIGNAKRAYICKDCPEKIVSNLDELVCYVIKNIFAGGCSREDLNQWMVDHGIVIKQLTPQMFTPSHGLVMTDYECRWEGG
jgi:hypothetical protein